MTQAYSLPPPIHSAPHSTSTIFTLLNPWQMQAKAEQAIPHSGQLHPKLNLESDAARIRNNINRLEDLNMSKNKPIEPIQSKEEPTNTKIEDFKN